MTTLEIRNLGYGYTADKKVISDIDLLFDKPGLYCILGPNGVGKSTLVKCINRIYKATEGSVLIDGRDIADMKQNEIADLIGYVPTSSEDTFSVPIVEAIQIGRFNKRDSTPESLEKVYRVMKLLHIRNIANRQFKELSAGQRQKVSMARGLVQETPILILDEPTANLDIKYQIYVTELLRAVAVSENMIVLMISHDINIAAKYAHEIIMMGAPGKVCHRGTPKEVITPANMKEIYSIDCEVTDAYGYPHVIPGCSVMDEDDGDVDIAPKGLISRLIHKA